MKNLFYSVEELKDFLLRSLNDNTLIRQVRDFLQDKQCLKSSKLSNWKSGDRCLPKSFVEGAAFALLSDYSSGFKGTADESDVHQLLYRHRDDLLRTRLWAESAWHIFFVNDDTGDPDFADVDVWRFWSNLRTFSIESCQQKTIERYLNYVSLMTGICLEAFTIGDDSICGKTSYENRTGETELSYACLITDEQPHQTGYQASIKKSIRKKQGEGWRHQFLDSVNIIPVKKSYLIVSIPREIIADLIAPWISSSYVLFPQTLRTLCTQKHLGGLECYGSEIYGSLEPWGNWGAMKEVVLNDSLLNRGIIQQEEIPPLLLHSLKNKWMVPSDQFEDRRILYQKFDFPHPLTFQSIVYSLPKSLD